ncbi:MAG: hypothetical protein ACKVQW_04585 [Pyrinomonadaceae bacterium]
MKCWASCLGDCSGVQSNEHYFSENLFKTGKVIVEGFPWLNGEKKEFGIAALTANILCEGHNNRLSPFDAEAGNVWEKLNKMNALQNYRDKFPNTKSWNFMSEKVDGINFERWVAKTAINLFCIVEKEGIWAMTKTKPREPPKEIVEAVYALKSFDKPIGLYIRASLGEKIEVGETVGFKAVFDRNKEFVAGIVMFKGIDFLLWFSTENALFLDNIPYHLPSLQFMHVYKNKYKHSHSLKFGWG